MSKSSNKRQYEQLKEWLSTRGMSNKTPKKTANNSRLDYYSEKQVK